MLLTVTNLTSEELAVPFPINRTLEASGGADSVTLGVSERDLLFGEDQGDPAYKRLNLLKQEGKISMSVADDPENSNLLDAVNATGSPSDPALYIADSSAVTAEVARYVVKTKGLFRGFSVIAAAALATAAATVTATKNGGAALGVASIASGGAAGDKDDVTLATPEPVVPGDVLEFTVGGGDTAAERLDISVDIDPAS